MIIKTIDELRKTVKINSSIPWATVEPFLQTARDIYLVRYLGNDLVEVLEMEQLPDRAEKLLELTKLCLGPLSVWCGNAELSVRLSDTGFTVEKKEGQGSSFLPASDTKIAKVEESLERRGFQYLDRVLEYLEENSDLFPEWKLSRYFTLRSGNYILSTTQFQEIGGVDINYSRLTFESLRPIMTLIETRYVSDMLGRELDNTIRNKLNGIMSPSEAELTDCLRKFIACKTAELYTSNTVSTGSDPKAFKPLIRQINSSQNGSGNYYAEQAAYFLNKVQQVLNKHAVEFGIELFDPALNWNTETTNFFCSEG